MPVDLHRLHSTCRSRLQCPGARATKHPAPLEIDHSQRKVPASGTLCKRAASTAIEEDFSQLHDGICHPDTEHLQGPQMQLGVEVFPGPAYTAQGT